MSLNKADFELVSKIVLAKSAIVLPEGKEYLVEARLGSLARKKGIDDIGKLVGMIRKNPNDELVEEVVDSLTTNETSFFRDGRPFEGLKQVIIPDLIEKRRATRQLTIWCGACSSGQEPYSVLMMLREEFPELNNWKIRFIATDYSPEMVKRCSEGRYALLEINRGLPARLMTKYCDKEGKSWRAKPELRSMLEVSRLNLMEPWALPPVDLVMMRNVLIYFSMETKKDILQRVRKTLRPDGYLMLGAAETTINIDRGYVAQDCGPSRCYRPRVEGAASSAKKVAQQ